MKQGIVCRIACLGTLSVAAMLMFAPTALAQDVLNCDDFDSQAEAQNELRANPDDPDNLDDDDDGIACETLPPPRDENPVPRPGGEQPKEQPKEKPKGQPQPKEQPKEQNRLMDAGGDLPQRSDAGDVPDDGGRFPLWRVAGMILSASVFVFAIYRLISNR